MSHEHQDLEPTPPIPPPRSRGFAIWATVLLILPAGIPYVTHWLPRDDGTVATGYMQYDFPIYYGKAREHFDTGAFRWTYSLPTSDRYDDPRIYVQPWTLALGAAHRWIHLPPGVLYDVFWLVSALFGSASAVALYAYVVGLGSWARRLGLILFFWGGGVLAVLGGMVQLAKHQPVTLRSLFVFDPTQGWWLLNFGRNLIFPTEAIYHGLTFLTVLATLRRRYVVACLLAFLTAFNSPFAGSGLLAVLWTWGLLETFYFRNCERVAGFFVAINVLLAGLVGYYLIFLNRFPEHRVVAKQMEFFVAYDARSFLPALALVGTMAIWMLRDSRKASEYLGSVGNRLLLIWFVVTFILSNHEFAVAPKQPIHFDRGYAWTALFLLGSPALIGLLEGLPRRLPRPLASLALASFVLLFVSDNLLWFLQFPVGYVRKTTDMELLGLRSTPDQASVLRVLDDRTYYGDLVVSGDEQLAYLAIAETPLRSWASHVTETPHDAERRREMAEAFGTGLFPDAWRGQILMAITPTRDGPVPAWVTDRGGILVYSNSSYAVHRVPPSP